jgi:hypothetical protein
LDKNKINEIGAKLNINTDSIKQRKEQQLMVKPLYILVQIIIFGISAIIGRVLVAIKEQATYPYSFYESSIIFSLLVITLHAGNGFITIPGQKKYGLSKNIRISVFLVTLLASLLAIQHYLSMAAAISYPQGVTYGVYSKDSRNKLIYQV